MSKKRKLELDRDELVKEAAKFHTEKSSNLVVKDFKKYFSEENFKTIHVRSSENENFKEIYGRILCDHQLCRHKSFKSRVGRIRLENSLGVFGLELDFPI